MKMIIFLSFLFSYTIAVSQKLNSTKLILKALGVSDEVASSTAKKAADEWDAAARNFADVLEREGLDDIGKIQKSLSKAGTDTTTLTDDVIENSLTLYFKNNPDVAKAILKEMPGFVDNAVKKIDLAQLIPDPDLLTALKDILDIPTNNLTPDIANDIILLKDYLQQNTNLGSLYSTNDDVKNLFDGLDLKISLAKGYIKPKADVPAYTPVMQKH